VAVLKNLGNRRGAREFGLFIRGKIDRSDGHSVADLLIRFFLNHFCAFSVSALVELVILPIPTIGVETYGRRNLPRRSIRIMSILGAIIIGLIVGVVAKLLTPGRDPGGWIITILLGLAGSFVAGFLGRSLGWYEEGQAAGFIASVVGAIILLLVYRLIARRRTS
jgi:uncharacterized membrane protein YeaQ/YmgE (transglycosylase-associated protein family)